jgi:hypothetical protein
MAGLMNTASAGNAAPKIQRPETNGNNNEATYTSVSGAGDANTPTSSAVAAASAAYGTAMYTFQHQSMPHIMPMIKRPALADKTGMPVYPQAIYSAQGMGHTHGALISPATQFMPVTLAGQPAQYTHY